MKKLERLLWALGLGILSLQDLAWAGSRSAPEIPAGASPFFLMGFLGLTLWTRSFFNKKK